MHQAERMALKDKTVWDLSLEEVRSARRELQLNNYVYAALEVDLSDNRPPLDRSLGTKNMGLPQETALAFDEFLKLSQYIGKEDPKNLRIHYTYRAHKLFASFRHLNMDHRDIVLALLAECAFLPIRIERLDNFPLWFHRIVRDTTPRIDKILEHCLAGDALEDFEDVWQFEHESRASAEEPTLLFPFRVTPRIAQALIVLDENGHDPKELARAWHYLEDQILSFETMNNLTPPTPEKCGVVNKGQLRYRNTLYLYGGEFFRRQGDLATALSWLRKDIDHPALVKYLGFYLTDMKTAERLLCAYHLDPVRSKDLNALIEETAFLILRNVSDYSTQVLKLIDDNPGMDLSGPQLKTQNQVMLYAGEASREPFLFALLYYWMYRGGALETIPYGKTMFIA